MHRLRLRHVMVKRRLRARPVHLLKAWLGARPVHLLGPQGWLMLAWNTVREHERSSLSWCRWRRHGHLIMTNIITRLLLLLGIHHVVRMRSGPVPWVAIWLLLLLASGI